MDGVAFVGCVFVGPPNAVMALLFESHLLTAASRLSAVSLTDWIYSFPSQYPLCLFLRNLQSLRKLPCFRRSEQGFAQRNHFPLQPSPFVRFHAVKQVIGHIQFLPATFWLRRGFLAAAENLATVTVLLSGCPTSFFFFVFFFFFFFLFFLFFFSRFSFTDGGGGPPFGGSLVLPGWVEESSNRLGWIQWMSRAWDCVLWITPFIRLASEVTLGKVNR